MKPAYDEYLERLIFRTEQERRQEIQKCFKRLGPDNTKLVKANLSYKRALELWSLRGTQNDIPLSFKVPGDLSKRQPNPKGMTLTEYRAVRTLKKAMAGNPCWMDAFMAFYLGDVHTKPLREEL